MREALEQVERRTVRTVDPWEKTARPEQLPPPGQWRIWFLCTGRKFGKLLDLDTPIATPDGFVALRDIRAGSTVFDERGRPSRVVSTFDDVPARAWKLIFSDGSQIVAGGEHLWCTWTKRDRVAWRRSADCDGAVPSGWPAWRNRRSLGPRVRTTDEIVSTLDYGKERNHSIPVAGPLELAERALPIDPWLFGYWLGNGDTRDPVVTCGHNDREWIESRIRRAGIEPRQYRYGGTAPRLGIAATRSALPLRRKHIPHEFLWSGTQQRLELLRGLMDSDGFCDKINVEFCSTLNALADGVLGLVRSLGERPTIIAGRSTLNGRDMGPKYRVFWTPTRWNPFSLPRKRDAVRPLAERSSRTAHRFIAAAEQVPVRPMRCLEVDSEHHLFLAGDALIATHNTRTAIEWAHSQARAFPEFAGFIAGRTLGDVAKYIVNHPESGLLATMKRDNRCEITEQKGGGGKIVRWENGAFADIHTSEEPDRARGGQYAWGVADEIASWRRVLDFEGNTTWDNLQFALTGGPDPRMVAASTPRRGNKLVKELLVRAEEADPDVRITRGSIRDNAANIAPSAIAALERRYGGTSLWRQEGEGKMLPDVEGAIVSSDLIETDRRRPDQVPELRRVGVAIDPSGGTGEIGIVAAGLGVDDHGYVLEDASGKYSPLGWARRSVALCDKWGGDFIVAERNFGGDMVESTVRSAFPTARVILVTASRGKHVRFEPIGGKYEQHQVHHVGMFELLEDEVTGFTPAGYDGDGSPNRGDALTWILTELMLAEASEYHFG